MVTSGPESVHSTVISTSTSKPPGQGTNGSEPSVGILAFSKNSWSLPLSTTSQLSRHVQFLLTLNKIDTSSPEGKICSCVKDVKGGEFLPPPTCVWIVE